MCLKENYNLDICRNLTGNNLSGGLPSNWGMSSVFAALRILDLSLNPNLSGALPPNWGTQGAFPDLQFLSLRSTGISGQLPAAWGAQDSLPALTHLDLSNNILAGAFPLVTVQMLGMLLPIFLAHASIVPFVS